MTLTLHRYRLVIYWRDFPVLDCHLWSFESFESFERTNESTGSHKSLSWDGNLVVSTPPLAKIVEFVVDGKTKKRLAWHGEEGVDATSVASLAARGERGFKVVEGLNMAKRANDQLSLFGGAEPEPVGAYGVRRARPDPVTPACEAIKAHQEAAAVLTVESRMPALDPELSIKTDDQVTILAGAIHRALAQIDKGQTQTAATILGLALEDAQIKGIY